MNRCANPCNCQPGDPEVGAQDYAHRRRHPDAGDLEALRTITWWLTVQLSQCHIRFSDGEFMSMLGEEGENCDGQPLLPGLLGRELVAALTEIAVARHPRVLVGGDWRRPSSTWGWLCKTGLVDKVRWCPSQVFVNGIRSGESMRWLEAVRAHPGQKFLVANPKVGLSVMSALDAHLLPVPEKNAYDAMGDIEADLRSLIKVNDVVIYAAGLGCKPTIWRMFVEHPGTTHLDVGCFFDGAAGLVSRSWLGGEPDEQLLEYRRTYVPWLLRRGEG